MSEEKKRYSPPLAVALTGAPVNGQQLDTRGTCYTGTGPGYCNAGIGPVDQCSAGNGALAAQTCRGGSYAAFGCRNGFGVYAQSCSVGERPFHCTSGSRA